MALISVVIPMYNEQECLGPMLERLLALPADQKDRYEYIFVDDGSTDGTLAMLRELAGKSEKVKYISFSRNFGHEAALTAGLDHAAGDAVITLDGDLQHPPEAIPDLLAKWREGYQIVYARRQSGEHLPLLKNLLSKTFYRLLRKACPVDIPADAANFRLMDRRAVEQYRRLRERSRFGRGLVAWTGFKQTFVPYAEERRYAGQTKYSTWASARLAIDAFIGFTDLPLRLVYWLAAAMLGVFGVLAALGIVAMFVTSMYALPYFAFASVFMVGGAVLLALGLVGSYVGRVFRQSQNRPLYIVADKSPSLPPGFEGARDGPDKAD
ncbi:MAG TPA: glycosyltransferase family 2 protein [Phycisphaerae bacterium]|nr:glycosyltransferase family 2 protein [Phycisphaerae bacterium]